MLAALDGLVVAPVLEAVVDPVAEVEPVALDAVEAVDPVEAAEADPGKR